MPAARTCSECGKSLAGRAPTAITCDHKCRLRRSRRVARTNRRVEEFQSQNNAGSAEIAQIVRNEAPAIVTQVMQNEIQPIVREAITEDVLRAINDLVGLTPTAVAALHDDLTSDDRAIRQRAYTLLIKYTVGHPALVKPVDVEDNSQIVVNFNLPRPDDVDAEADTPVAEVEAFQTCDMCQETKPAAEFAAGSARCQSCFEEWRERIMSEFTTA